MNAAQQLYPNDFEQRAVDSCRGILDDIPECSEAEMSVRFMSRIPYLIIAFGLPALEYKPACAVRLTTISLSKPLSPGAPLEGDRLRRAVRNATEQYLHRHGVRPLTPQFEVRALEN
jgi:hypothetical protein